MVMTEVRWFAEFEGGDGDTGGDLTVVIMMVMMAVWVL